MEQVKTIYIDLPDSGRRELRGPNRARRLIHELCGPDIVQAVRDKGDGILVQILFILMHDRKGNPPEDLTVEQLELEIPGDREASIELLALIFEAMSNGKVTKKKATEAMQQLEGMAQPTGTTSMDSADKPLESRGKTSGGGSSRTKSTRASAPTGNSRSESVSNAA